VGVIPLAGSGRGFALRLGLRPGEARALDVADFDFAHSLLDVKHAMQGQGHDARRGPTKEQTRRVVEVDTELRNWIAKHVDPLGRVEGRPPFPPSLCTRKGSGDRRTMSSLEYE
jgi:integrase